MLEASQEILELRGSRGVRLRLWPSHTLGKQINSLLLSSLEFLGLRSEPLQQAVVCEGRIVKSFLSYS